MMFRIVSEFEGISVKLKDFEIGKVEDCLLNDSDWSIQYILGENYDPEYGFKFLISPSSIIKVEVENDKMLIELNNQKINTLKDILKEPQVYLELEGEFVNYMKNTDIYSLLPPNKVMGEIYSKNETTEIKIDDDHLRSVRDLRNYKINSTDGDAGYLHSFIIDTKDWEIKFLIIGRKSSGNLKIGREKYVLVSPEIVSNIVRNQSKIDIILKKSALENSQALSPDKILNHLSKNYFEKQLKMKN